MNEEERLSLNRYKEVFRQCYPHVLAYTSGIVGSDEAADIVQDVFADLWERRAFIEMGEQVEAFLIRAAYTRALNSLKHKNVTQRYIDAVMAIEERREQLSLRTPLREMMNSELNQAMSQAIGQLPDKCQEVFRMSYLQGLRNKEIASRMGLSVKTVDAHIYKALKTLRAQLKDVKRWTPIIALLFFN